MPAPFVPALPGGATDRSRFEAYDDDEEEGADGGEDSTFPYMDDGTGWTDGF
jgi:hypothetical protein